MKQEKPYVLAMNGGSSSIKFTLYRMGDSPARRLHGKVDRIGLRGATLTFDDLQRNQHDSRIIGDFDHRLAANFLIDWLDKQIGLTSIEAVGHRVVSGGAHYNEPQRVTAELLDALRRISAYAPEHLPSEIGLIDLFRERVPGLPQVVCFDTAFHRDMPRVAKILPIPRRFQAQGVERYGFHGLSYSFLMEELARVAGARCTARLCGGIQARQDFPHDVLDRVAQHFDQACSSTSSRKDHKCAKSSRLVISLCLAHKISGGLFLARRENSGKSESATTGNERSFRRENGNLRRFKTVVTRES